MSVCFIENKKSLCLSIQKTTSSKVLMTPSQWFICSKSPSTTIIITLIESSSCVSFYPSSNNTPSNPPSRFGNIIKTLTEVKYDD